MIKFIKTALAESIEMDYYNSDSNSTVPMSFTPTRATAGSSGYDLRACILEDIVLAPNEVVKIGTGVKIWIGDMMDVNSISDFVFAGLLLPRSSSKGAILSNTVGLLDSDYQGELFCKYRNITTEPITITVGEAFAQLIIIPTYIGTMIEVESFEDNTVRGDGGFGSTGV